MNAPLYLARSGDIDGGFFYNKNYGSFYWSSTVGSSESARTLNFTLSSVLSENYNGRYFGFSLRCVLREPENNPVK
jgi:hypothetical protein